MFETFDEICLLIIIIVAVAFLSVLATTFLNRPLKETPSYMTLLEPTFEMPKVQTLHPENKREKIVMGNGVSAYVDEDGEIYL